MSELHDMQWHELLALAKVQADALEARDNRIATLEDALRVMGIDPEKL